MSVSTAVTDVLLNKPTETFSARFSKLGRVVKVDLTGQFDENLVTCVSATFI